MTVLVVNTAAPTVQVGLWRNPNWLYQHRAQGHSHTALFEALLQSGLQPADLTDVIVSIGPGSYTGLRTGASFANTLKLDLPGVNLWAVNQFQLCIGSQPTPTWVVLPALRQVAYVAHVDERYQTHHPGSVALPEWHPAESVPIQIDPSLMVFLPDALKTRVSPLAGSVDYLAQSLTLWQKGYLIEIDRVEPLYIQPPHITRPNKA